MLLATMQIPLAKRSRLPRSGEGELERARWLGELAGNDILNTSVPQRGQVLGGELGALLGEIVGSEIVEDDVKGNLVRAGVLGADVLGDLGDGGLAADKLDFGGCLAGASAVGVGAGGFWVGLHEVEAEVRVAGGGAGFRTDKVDGPWEESEGIIERKEMVDVEGADTAKRNLEICEWHGIVASGGDLALVWSMDAKDTTRVGDLGCNDLILSHDLTEQEDFLSDRSVGL